DDEQQIVCMYRQFDGYPSGHGKELAEFLTGIKMVNGISRDDEKQRIANGAGCLAAQIVEHFKRENGAGGIYLMPFDVDAGQEYIYKVKV
ncbi:hypothetical protein, partial [Streptococcus pneumoniae]|uniref:hypothetical protein n=1 Tax=Streptococcus pneumoniae TaxID=1313 RepID=UPI0018B0C329